jgi:hypothetical protein
MGLSGHRSPKVVQAGRSSSKACTTSSWVGMSGLFIDSRYSLRPSSASRCVETLRGFKYEPIAVLRIFLPVDSA